MRHCQIQCTFGGIDDLCTLGTDMQTIHFILDKILKLWRITRLSIISRCKVIWSQN